MPDSYLRVMDIVIFRKFNRVNRFRIKEVLANHQSRHIMSGFVSITEFVLEGSTQPLKKSRAEKKEQEYEKTDGILFHSERSAGIFLRGVSGYPSAKFFEPQQELTGQTAD